MNNVSLMGRLVKDVDLNYIAGSGKAKGTFTIAVQRKFKKDEANFINCVVFGKTAEIISQYIFKGTMIGITGNIRNNNYKKKDGTMAYTTNVIVENFTFCDSSKKNSNSNNNLNLDDLNFIDDGENPFV